MIDKDLRVDGFDPQTLVRLRRLISPIRAERVDEASAMKTAPLVLILDGESLVKAIRVPLQVGSMSPASMRLDPGTFSWRGPSSLVGIRRQAGARIAVAVERRTLDRVARQVDARLDAGDDLVAQGLTFLRSLKAELGVGIHLDPDPFRTVPVPSYAALQQTLDLLLPDGKSAGLFVFERAGSGGIYTSAIVEKRRGDVVRLTSHPALGHTPSGFSGGRHKDVLAAMGRAVAPPHVALFCSREAFRQIAGPQPGALAQQLALQGAVIDPAPPWIVALTGAAAVAGVAREASRLFGRFVPESIRATAKAVAQTASQSQASPFTQLGFDPIQLFTELRKLFE